MNSTLSFGRWPVFGVVVSGGLAGCGGSSSGSGDGGIDPQVMADALHAIMEADRTVYSQQIVNRLQDEEQVITASEHWLDERVLPLAAVSRRRSNIDAAGAAAPRRESAHRARRLPARPLTPPWSASPRLRPANARRPAVWEIPSD